VGLLTVDDQLERRPVAILQTVASSREVVSEEIRWGGFKSLCSHQITDSIDEFVFKFLGLIN
tara:strand:- start:1431 stop:1616 length:186 start_codon:yes stop_codon:yes gene_type:complete